MKKFKYRISIVLVVAIVCSFSINTSAFAIKDQNELLINTNQPQIQQFEVASLNTITGVETTKQYNTSLTANALSRGITEMSTPAHIGSDPLLYNSEDGLYNSITPQGIVGSDNRIRVTSPPKFFPISCNLQNSYILG